MFTPLSACYVPVPLTCVNVSRGLTKLSAGGSFALLVGITDGNSQSERQNPLASAAVSARAAVSSHVSSDGSAPAGHAYRSADHYVMAATAIPTLRSQISPFALATAWPARSKAPAWRHAAHTPFQQDHQVPGGHWGGDWPQRWLPRTPHSLTDDGKERPLPLPRSHVSRPWGQGTPHMVLEVGTPTPPAQSKVFARHLTGDARNNFRIAVRQPERLIGLDWCGPSARGGHGCRNHGSDRAAAATIVTAMIFASRAGGQHIGFCRSCTTGSKDGGCGGWAGVTGGGRSGEVGGRRSPERVVSEHVGRQGSATAGQLDPVGARDSSQLPGTSTQHAEPLPRLDELRPLPIGSAGGSGGAWASLSSETASKDDVSGSGNRLAVPSWVGQTVWAVPCSTVGYGTRAEVVARLPASIMLLRHAECMRLDELQAHERVPNHDIPLSEGGLSQARVLGQRLRPALEAAGMHLYIYTSPFLRCSETARLLAEELEEGGLVSGVREAVQLREQDWGNFQDPRVQAECKAERLRYGRFYYRFPSGESVADVYDRLTMFQDHLVRDMCAGRFAEDTCVAIVSHGLTLRVFVMRWLHWTVRQFLQVYNIPNAEPVLLHKEVHPSYLEGKNARLPFLPHHTKCLYKLTPRALELLRGADNSMATSNGCWHARDLVRSQPAALAIDEEDRLWADVEGMV